MYYECSYQKLNKRKRDLLFVTPQNIKLKFASKCKSFSKFKKRNLDQQLKQFGEIFVSFCSFVNPNSKTITVEIDHVVN